MCTVTLRVNSSRRWSVQLVAVRDELYARPTASPGRHWPDRDAALVGALDLEAGGTFLAVHPLRRAVAAVVNAPPRAPSGSVRAPTRGVLPLLKACDAQIASEIAHGMPGFHLVSIQARVRALPSVTLTSWDGASLAERELATGNHVVTAAGLQRRGTVASALAAVPRPSPLGAVAWQSVVRAATIDDEDLPAGRYGSVSASMVELSAAGIRYRTCSRPPSPEWHEVLEAPA